MRYIESIKIENGTIVNIELHSERILRTIGECIDLNLHIPPKYSVGVVKMRVVYDKEGINDISFSSYTLPKIESLKLINCDDIDYSLKYENRDYINLLTSQKGSCDDILIMKNGLVSDTSFCNIVFQNKNGLFTPKTPLLKGTKREYLIQKGTIKEADITSSDISLYDNILLINAMIEINEIDIKIQNIAID